jgi:3-hydroxyisobutyrate dehydrogenase
VGIEVSVWTRTAAAADPLVELGARAERDPSRAVAGQEVVVSALFGPDAVRAVFTGADLPLPAGALWIDITTLGPADAESSARWAGERGVSYVHAPVIGSLAPARNRALSTLLGGSADAVARARQIVVWADPERIRIYDTPAKAAVAKLIANLTLAVGMQGIVEALRLGHSGDLGTAEILSALDLTMFAALAKVKGPVILERDFADTQFSADLLAKDTRLMMRTSDSALPATAAAFAALRNAIDAGEGGADFSVLAAPEVR